MDEILEKNLAYIRTLSSPDMPDIGSRLYESLRAFGTRIQNLSMQVNGNTGGEPQAPQSPNNVSVTGSGGYLHVAIDDDNDIYRGIQYFAVHSDSDQFTNPHVVPMGTSRNISIPVGNNARHVAVYSSYPNSPSSKPVYFGGSQPKPVGGYDHGQDVTFQASKGSGTSPTGSGFEGPGLVPFRSKTGVPPTRG